MVVDNIVSLAEMIAKKAFEGKKDLAGKPYMEHLKRVSNKVESCHESLKVVAMLHDLLEDCPEWNEKVLRTFFNDGIVDSIVALTRKIGQTYDEFIDQILQDDWATKIKKYDLEDNMDMTRLKEITKDDLRRLEKYHKAYIRITSKK